MEKKRAHSQHFKSFCLLGSPREWTSNPQVLHLSTTNSQTDVSTTASRKAKESENQLNYVYQMQIPHLAVLSEEFATIFSPSHPPPTHIEIYYPHSTAILEEYFENIPLESCNIAKIFIKLLERFLKYCRNLEMSVQNIINGILL